MPALETETITVDGTDYVLKTYYEEGADNPWTQLGDMLFHVYGPHTSPHTDKLTGAQGFPFTTEEVNRIPENLYDATFACSWYDRPTAGQWLEVYRHAQPGGFVRAYWYDENRHSGYPSALSPLADDDHHKEMLLFSLSAQELTETWAFANRPLAEVNQYAEDSLNGYIHEFNCWADGEVYYGIVETEHGDQVGYAFGTFYGSDCGDDLRDAAKEQIREYRADRADDRARFMEAEAGLPLLAV